MVVVDTADSKIEKIADLFDEDFRPMVEGKCRKVKKFRKRELTGAIGFDRCLDDDEVW